MNVATVDKLTKYVSDPTLAALLLNLSVDMPESVGMMLTGYAEPDDLAALSLALQAVIPLIRLRKTVAPHAPEPITPAPTRADGFAEQMAITARHFRDLATRIQRREAFSEHFAQLLDAYRALQPRYAAVLTEYVQGVNSGARRIAAHA